MFSIFLPNDNEKWFKTSFGNRERAVWFAEANDLGRDEFEVRPSTSRIKPAVSVEMIEPSENKKMVA